VLLARGGRPELPLLRRALARGPLLEVADGGVGDHFDLPKAERERHTSSSLRRATPSARLASRSVHGCASGSRICHSSQSPAGRPGTSTSWSILFLT
jgi:hypothetical protein